MIQIQIQLKQDGDKLGMSIDSLATEDVTAGEIQAGEAVLEGVKMFLEELTKNES